MRREQAKRLSQSGLTLLYSRIDGRLLRIFRQERGNRTVSFTGADEFLACITANGETRLIASRDCAASEIMMQDDSLSLRFEHELFRAEVRYTIDGSMFHKRISFTAKTALMLRQLVSETTRTAKSLSRGGEGQPVFIGGEMFTGIEFPAANNQIFDDQLYFSQAPYLALQEGEQFPLYPIVFGFADSSSLSNSFENYIREHALPVRNNIRIYCDWGAHDELSDNIPLDEGMALAMVERLAEARRTYGVRFDYYLMDAFWFEEGHAYLDFKAACWPEGPDRFLQKLEENDLKFGLWFDVNLNHAKMVGWEAARRGKDTTTFCLAEGESIRMLHEALRHHITRHRVKIIKFDFAYFDCDNPAHDCHMTGGTASKEPALRRFLEMLADLRQLESELVVLAYNGFTTELSWLGSVVPDRPGFMVSPWWSFFIDYIYCGDPRASEIPTPAFADSMHYYTDAMIRQMQDALMPFEHIDDHGTMVGNTGTIYYLGKQAFRDSWIMNLSRGGKKQHFYGDLALLGEADWVFLKAAEEMADTVNQPACQTHFLLASPLSGRPYGYCNSNGAEGYFTLVNPCAERQTVFLDLEQELGLECIEVGLWYEGGEIRSSCALTPLQGCLQAELAPYTIQVYQWRAAPDREAHPCRLLLGPGERVTLSLHQETKTVMLQFFDESGLPMRTGSGLPPDFDLETTLSRSSPAALWSGISWVVLKRQPTDEVPCLDLVNHGTNKILIKWKELAI